jgi:hypothetical protein
MIVHGTSSVMKFPDETSLFSTMAPSFLSNKIRIALRVTSILEFKGTLMNTRLIADRYRDLHDLAVAAEETWKICGKQYANGQPNAR